jgi:ATP synthase protein I
MKSADSIDKLVLTRAGGVTGVVGGISVIVGWLIAGTSGFIGAFIGAAIVVIFFTVGQFFLGRVLRTNPQMALTVALTIYLLKVGVLLILIILFAETTLFDTKVFAATIIACTLAWTIAEMWIFATTKVLYVEPESSP